MSAWAPNGLDPSRWAVRRKMVAKFRIVNCIGWESQYNAWCDSTCRVNTPIRCWTSAVRPVMVHTVVEVSRFHLFPLSLHTVNPSNIVVSESCSLGINSDASSFCDLDTKITQSSHLMATIVLWALEAASEASKCLMGDAKCALLLEDVTTISVRNNNAKNSDPNFFIVRSKYLVPGYSLLSILLWS